MKLTIDRTACLGAVEAAASAAAKSPVASSILTDIMLAADKDTFSAYGTNLSIYVTAARGTTAVQKPGRCCVPAAEFAAAIKKTHAESVRIEGDAKHVTLAGNGSTFTFNAGDPDDFPMPPPPPEAALITMPRKTFADMIARTAFCVSADRQRYALNGILVQSDGQTITLCATDGRRLSRATRTLESPATAWPGDVILPPELAQAACAHAGGDEIRISCVGNLAHIAWTNGSACMPLIEGRFPPVNDVIPDETPIAISVAREDLIDAIDQARILSAGDAHAIALTRAGDTLVVRGENIEKGTSRIAIDAAFEGETKEIKLNSAFILDALRAISDDDVRLGCKDHGHAQLMQTDAVTCLIMPIAQV